MLTTPIGSFRLLLLLLGPALAACSTTTSEGGPAGDGTTTPGIEPGGTPGAEETSPMPTTPDGVLSVKVLATEMTLQGKKLPAVPLRRHYSSDFEVSIGRPTGNEEPVELQSQTPKGCTTAPVTVPSGATNATITIDCASAPADPASIYVTEVAAKSKTAAGKTQFFTSVDFSRGYADPHFGTNGSVGIGIDASSILGGVAVQSDGKLLVAFTTQPAAPGVPRAAIARLTVDGKLDATFGSGGKVTPALPAGSTKSYGTAVAVGVGDGIFVGVRLSSMNASSTTNRAVLYKLTPSGAPDTTFASGIANVGANTTFNEEIGKIVAASNGSVLSLRSGAGGSLVTETSAAGQTDTSFATGGTFKAGGAKSIVQRPTGELLVGDSSGVTQLTGAGVVDASFGTNGTLIAGGGASLFAFALRSDKSIVGVFQMPNPSNPANTLRRIGILGTPPNAMKANVHLPYAFLGSATLVTRADSEVEAVLSPPDNTEVRRLSVNAAFDESSSYETTAPRKGVVGPASLATSPDGHFYVVARSVTSAPGADIVVTKILGD
jgi:uncharacterized delta-60 repeat protein